MLKYFNLKKRFGRNLLDKFYIWGNIVFIPFYLLYLVVAIIDEPVMVIPLLILYPILLLSSRLSYEVVLTQFEILDQLKEINSRGGLQEGE